MMMKLHSIVLFFTLALVAGCTTSKQFSGNYHTDREYLSASYEMMKLDSKTVERLSEHGPKLVINYPEIIMTSYGTSFDANSNITKVTEECQTNSVKQINDQLYLWVNETTRGDVYIPMYFDDVNDSIYMLNYKFIKER